MKFFWVNVGQTYDEVKQEAFLWAPLRSRQKNTPGVEASVAERSHGHWRVVADVKKGDIIFANVDRNIMFIAVALRDAYEAPCPPRRAFANWHMTGNRVDVELFELSPPVSVRGQIRASFEAVHNATSSQKIFTVNGTIFQGYMAALSDAAGVELLHYAGEAEAHAVERSNSLNPPKTDRRGSERRPTGTTTRQAIREARVGQGYFRQELLSMWQRCPVTGLSEHSLLIASHSKPWSQCNDDERLDPYNGFVFAPHIDRLFDKGLIGFDASGQIIISKLLSLSDQKALGIHSNMRINLHANHKRYLADHRKLFGL